MEAHLTDDEAVGHVLQTLDLEMRQRAERHMEACPLCAAELDRLRDLSRAWEDEVAIRRLQRRVQSVVAAPQRAQATRSHARRRVFQISLRRLLLPQGAFGEGRSDEANRVEFPIIEGGKEVAELRGALQRKNREYYVRVAVARPRDRTAFDHRRVAIVLSDSGEDTPLLRRNIDVGVTVLLGTDLRLTEKSYIRAELLPAEEARRSGDEA